MRVEVENHVDLYCDRLVAHLDETLAWGAQQTNVDAQALSPIGDTGILKAGWHVVPGPTGALVYYVENDVFYAAYVEFGTGIYAENGMGRKTPWVYYSDATGWVTTRGNPHQPMARPAYERNWQKIVAKAANPQL